MGLKFRIEVNAKPEEVFDYVADFSRHGEWGTSGLKVEKISDGPIGAGSKFRSTQKFQGKQSTAEITIRDYERPRLLRYAAVQTTGGGKPAIFIQTLSLTPTAKGTTVERDVSRENASPLAALGIIFYPAIKSDAMKGLRQMKAKVESGSS